MANIDYYAVRLSNGSFQVRTRHDWTTTSGAHCRRREPYQTLPASTRRRLDGLRKRSFSLFMWARRECSPVRAI